MGLKKHVRHIDLKKKLVDFFKARPEHATLELVPWTVLNLSKKKSLDMARPAHLVGRVMSAHES